MYVRARCPVLGKCKPKHVKVRVMMVCRVPPSCSIPPAEGLGRCWSGTTTKVGWWRQDTETMTGCWQRLHNDPEQKCRCVAPGPAEENKKTSSPVQSPLSITAQAAAAMGEIVKHLLCSVTRYCNIDDASKNSDNQL